MPTASSISFPELSEFPLLESMKAGLRLLLEASCYARELGQDVWDFGVEIHVLNSTGLDVNQIRWLLYGGFLIQAVETTRCQSARRLFRPYSSLRICAASCFVLTEKGIKLARDLFGQTPEKDATCSRRLVTAMDKIDHQAAAAGKDYFASAQVPCWRQDIKALFLGPHLVKKFKRPATNQFLILDAFEARGWPARIGNPLSTDCNGEAVERLHDAIKRLNYHHHTPFIRFCGDGTGQGVTWKITRGLLRGGEGKAQLPG